MSCDQSFDVPALTSPQWLTWLPHNDRLQPGIVGWNNPSAPKLLFAGLFYCNNRNETRTLSKHSTGLYFQPGSRILSAQLGGINHIHIVFQSILTFTPETVHVTKLRLCIQWSLTVLSLFPASGNPHPSFSLGMIVRHTACGSGITVIRNCRES